MGVLVWEISSVLHYLSLFVFHKANIMEQWPTLLAYNTLTVCQRSSTRASYRTRLGCYICDLQPSHGLSSTVIALLFAIISFRSLFCSCSDLESNLIFRFWVYTEERGIQEQLSGLSQVAAFAVSRCWMPCGSKEERWTANFLSDQSTSSAFLLAPYKWWDVKEIEAAPCNICH